MEEPAKQPCSHGHHDHHDCDHHDHDHHAHEHGAKEDIHSGVHVEARLHEGAVVASGEMRIPARNDGQIREILGHDMKALAAWVEKSDGIIGHIKASVETTRTDIYSITDCELSERTADAVMVGIKIAAIVYGVESDALLHRLETLLKHLEAIDTSARKDV
ncbi:MAG: hypothetical protein HGA54_00255 [Actinobacteria bacterium]|nr:hypothetical protein [Actinomycetota bacterium]